MIIGALPKTDFKIMMLGGLGCGKTSSLAVMLDELEHGPASHYLAVVDKTPPHPGVPSLKSKRLKIVDAAKNSGTNSFVLDNAPSPFVWDYEIRVSVQGNISHRINLIFKEIPECILSEYSCYDHNLLHITQECDIYIVVVDTPYLMGNGTVAKLVNKEYAISSLLRCIDNDSGLIAKKVIFVPVKCEKWIKEGQIDSVVAKIEKIYEPLIKYLEYSRNFEISIIPIETAGGIVFDKFRDIYRLTKSNGEVIRGSKVTDELFRNQNGEIIEIEDGDDLQKDPTAAFLNIELSRPGEWFKLIPDAEYRPHNCDQLALHVLRFIVNKKMSDKYFKITLAELTKRGVIRNEGDGIMILK